MTKFIWIIGCPRSGTTMLIDYIAKYVDFSYMEPWESHTIRKPETWDFPDCKSIVFKYCENWRDADYIATRWPNSFFVHVWRDPDNVINSMAFPKPTSYPQRNLYPKHESNERVRLSIERWYEDVNGCLTLGIEQHRDKYLEIQYEKIPNQIFQLGKKLDLPFNEIDFDNRNVETDIDWSCNPDARLLRNQIRNHLGDCLATYIQTKRRIF
jgi:hypothetical protein